MTNYKLQCSQYIYCNITLSNPFNSWNILMNSAWYVLYDRTKSIFLCNWLLLQVNKKIKFSSWIIDFYFKIYTYAQKFDKYNLIFRYYEGDTLLTFYQIKVKIALFKRNHFDVQRIGGKWCVSIHQLHISKYDIWYDISYIWYIYDKNIYDKYLLAFR